MVMGTSLLLLLQTGYTRQAQAEEPWQLLSSQRAGAGWRKETSGQPLNLPSVCLSQFACADLCPFESTHVWFLAKV